MAYFFGFWIADGYLIKHKSSSSIGIGVHKKDRYILEKFNSLVESENTVKDRKNREFSEVL
jgi:hypothetical protein